MSSFGIHKSWIILSLVIASMTMLFLASCVAMVYLQIHKDLKSVPLPWLFYFNTAILLASSYILHKVNVNTVSLISLRNNCKQVLLLSILFLILQSLAWYSLLSAAVTIQSDRMSAFLYFISGLHFIHVLGGIPFLFFFYLKIKKEYNHGHYKVDESNKLQFKILRTYWHFLDALWIFLIAFLTLLIMVF
ncbi:MAG: cytochrome c oxidase subunit III [Saprospiraceae bacterium]|nr:cytochrome c oxidase subunit III [Saprospiraceae bacterium]